MSGEDAIRHEAQFLLDRIAELDWCGSMDDFAREWNGHVEPPLHRLKSLFDSAPLPPPPTDLTNRLRELEQAATAGPWKVGHLESYFGDWRPFRCVYRGENETVDTRLYVKGGTGENGQVFDCDADANLIVELRNSASTLLTLIETQAAQIERLRAALENARKFVSLCQVDADPDVQEDARNLLPEIDEALTLSEVDQRAGEVERAAIVAWLRELIEAGECLPPTWVRDAIERGEHIPTTGEG